MDTIPILHHRSVFILEHVIDGWEGNILRWKDVANLRISGKSANEWNIYISALRKVGLTRNGTRDGII